MRAVLQRVSQASVTTAGRQVAQINQGWLIFLGIQQDDSAADLAYIVSKTLQVRGFCDPDHKMNLSISDIDGDLLVVSQFTLYGDCRKGRRPSFSQAALPREAEALYEAFVTQLREAGRRVATGVFGADMQVMMTGQGPVTLLLDSRRLF